MKQYLNILIEESYSPFTRMKGGIKKAGLVALVCAIIVFGIYGCKKEEPEKEENLPETSVSLEGNLENTKIAFASTRDGNLEIYVMNADGSAIKNLTNNPGLDKDPSWSGDGKKIAFMSLRDGNMEIYIMNADGNEQKRLTYNPAHDEEPSWSPDGTKIAFTSDRDRNNEIYVMNADGSGQKRLTNNSGVEQGPSWSPDGKNIAFCSNRVVFFRNLYYECRW
jgi:TolB protein